MQITDFIPIGATLVSFVGSFFISKLTAKNEIRKMTVQFQREDAVNLKESYSNVISAVNTFSCTITKKNQDAAFTALGKFSSLCPSKMRNTYNLITSKIKQFDFSNEGYYINQNKRTELNTLLSKFESDWELLNSCKKRNKDSSDNTK